MLRRSNERGSALVIATIMIVVMTAMIGLLLSAPFAQVRQVGNSTSKERSLFNADAGVRDAIVAVQCQRVQFAGWLQDSTAASPPGQTMAISLSTGVTASTWLSSAGLTAPTGLSATAPTANVAIAQYSSSFFGTDGFPIFTDNNFKSFGAANGKTVEGYAWTMLNMGSAYYKVLVEGRALALNQYNSTDAKYIVTKIEAYIYNPLPVTSTPAAVTFINNNNGVVLRRDNGDTTGAGPWSNVDNTFFTDPSLNPPTKPMVWASTSGGGPDKVTNDPTGMITGTDQGGTGNNTSGFAFQNNTVAVSEGSTSWISGGGSNTAITPGSPTLYNNMSNMIDTIAALPAGTSGVNKIEFNGNNVNLSTGSPIVNYIHISSSYNSSNPVDTNLIQLSSSSSSQPFGLIIIDIESGVDFEFSTSPGGNCLFRADGSGSEFRGAFLIRMKGNVKVPATGWYVIDARATGSNSPPRMAWDYNAYTTALTNVNVPMKLMSYRVVK